MTDAGDTPIPEKVAGTAQARIVNGANRLQVLVAGSWYDVEGVATADAMTADRRYAGRVVFKKIGTISLEAAGLARAGAAHRQAISSSPAKTMSQGSVTRPTAAPPASPAPAPPLKAG